MWGITPTDNDASIDNYKIAQGITNPCAGTDGGGPEAIDVVTAGQNFLGYPTYIVICPDKTMYFDVCWPPDDASCFDTYIEDCGFAVLSADFSADATEICKFTTVEFEDLSAGAITSWNWTFEGGDPATSTEQNPVVLYNGVGTFDVQLEVSDGTESNSFTIEDYILVEECTGIGETGNEILSLYPNPSKGEFEIQLTESGEFNISVYNLLGKEILSAKASSHGMLKHTINLQDSPGGVYIVTVQGNKDIYVKKIRLLK